MVDLKPYHAALEGIVYYQLPNPGYLRIGGSDRVDFLQRQTTNDVRQLDSTRALTSVLTSPTARVLDVFTLINEGEQIGVLTLPGRGDSTAGFLRTRIFFNDDVSLDDRSQDYAQIIVEGPGASDALTSLGVSKSGLGQFTQSDIDDVPITIIGQSGIGDVGYRILVPNAANEKVNSALAQAGAVPINEDTFQGLRVEIGIPGEQGELTEDYTPLELGLLDTAISQNKGCYTGQEVIARQVNFDKITRRLIGLRLDAPVEVGAAIRVDQKPAGQVTSVVNSPRFGEIALAVLKRPNDQAGTKVTIGEIKAEVVDLPFK